MLLALRVSYPGSVYSPGGLFFFAKIEFFPIFIPTGSDAGKSWGYVGSKYWR